MQKEDVKFVQRRTRITSLDVHPTDKALVIGYELEATLVGELGDPMLEETKECQKIIRVKSLTDTTDVSALAEEIVSKCSLIPPSKVQQVVQLLYYLQNRKGSPQPRRVGSAILQPKKYGQWDGSCLQSAGLERDPAGLWGNKDCEGSEPEEVASLQYLETYTELLYEDMPEKVRASALLLQLSRNPDNLALLSKNETVLGVLTRVLREDGRKSIDLSTNIVYIFFCFSTFSQFHNVIAHFKVGSLCMDLIEHELKRHEQWKEDMAKKKHSLEVDKENIILKKDFEKSLKKYQNLVKKQDQLLRVSYYLLLNISEDTKVEMKMVSRGVVPLLIRSLDRELPELLILILSFLKKLSIFVENKNEMSEHNVVEKVSRLVSIENGDLLNVTLRLLLNLSFDLDLRNSMVKIGLLPKLVNLMANARHQPVVLCVLYHISMDDRCKSVFTYTDCIPILMKLLTDGCWEDRVPLQVVAVGINLATNKRNAQLMCEGNRLQSLFKRAFQSRDPLLMKMIRNISQHQGPTKTYFLDFVGLLGESIQKGGCEEFTLECLGILGNLTIPDLDYERLLSEYNLIPWLKSKIVPGSCEDDVVLEVVVLIGTVAADEGCAVQLAKSGILNALVDLLNAKQEDDEVVLQIVYVFYHMIKHAATRELMIKDTQVPAYLIDLMHDKNIEIRKVCDNTLDIIAEHDDEWSKRIQVEKFRWHNSQWLDTVESLQDQDFLMDDASSPYADQELLLGSQDLLYAPPPGCDGLLSDGSLSPDLTDPDHMSNGRQSEAGSGRPMSRYKNSCDQSAFVETTGGRTTPQHRPTSTLIIQTPEGIVQPLNYHFQ